MKIAIDARIIRSGTGRYIRELVANLEQIDHANDYLILVRRADLHYYQPRNPRFRLVEADFADYSWQEQWQFNQLLRSLNVDLVHFCMPQQPLLYTKPAVTTVHDLNLLRITTNDSMGWLELRVKQLVFRALLWTVARRAQRLITPSHFTEADLQRFAHVAADKIIVTYEGGVTPAVRTQPLPTYQNVPFIMYLGRAEAYKNNRALIEAHQNLLTTYPDLRLAIVGAIDDLRQADMAWVTARGYKNVDFTGFVSDEQQAWLYANCRAYVMPSLMEGFGLPALEAMAGGAAVVSSNTTASPEILGDAAHYFDPHKTGDLARAITDVLADEALRRRLITKGATQAKKYSWRRMAEQTLAIYSDVFTTISKKPD